MYGRYVVKRILYGIVTYMVIILIYSALFNAVMDTTLKTQISEQIQSKIMAVSRQGTMDDQEIKNYQQELKNNLYKQYHLNDPILLRIFWRAVDTISFNFGKATAMSSSSGEKMVFDIIREAIPRTILLFTFATIINLFIGILFGLKKAQKPGKLMDQSSSIMTMIVYGMPSWWLGMIMIMLLVYFIPLFPSGGIHASPPPEGIFYFLDLLYHMTLPVLTLVIIGFWGTSYLVRNIVLGTLQEDYIMAARARGLSENKVLYGHALRSSAPPIVTMAVMSLLFSFAGNIIFEGVFSWPGMGNLYWVAVRTNDLPVLMGNLAITTLFYLSGYVLLDIIYGYLDPRIKVGGKA